MKSPLTFLTAEEYSRWSQIRGWLLPDAAEMLHQQAKQAIPGGTIVEIGSFAGKSTVCLNKGLEANGRSMTAIDLRFQPDFDRNLDSFGYLGQVRKLQGPSLDHFEHWDEAIALLYIDGHHGKGYALADLLLWDWYVMPGGCVALDDTAGFMIGPNLQIQVATANGAYEFLCEAGGVSFLRKNHSITGLSGAPASHSVWFALLHRASAWLGAMDPLLRQARLPHQPEPMAEWLSRFWHSSPAETLSALRRRFLPNRRAGKTRTSRTSDLDWLEARAPDGAAPTLDYLRACEAFRQGRLDQAASLMNDLSGLESAIEFLHFAMPIREVASLRAAQFLDVQAKRQQAVEIYQDLALKATCRGVRDCAGAWLGNPFMTTSGTPATLLREYNMAWHEFKRHIPE